MKLFLGYLLGFAIMTAICFVICSAIMLFIPALEAFLSWSLAPLTLNVSTMLFVARLMFIPSAIVGIAFATSKEGKAFAHEFAEGKNG